MRKDGCDLRGLGILVTRPAAQAESLAELIRAHGGRPMLFPTIEIRPPDDPAPARTLLTDLADFDIVIFISRNAVEFALPLVDLAQLRQSRIAAVGAATARALNAEGLNVALQPAERFDSEALLQLADLQQVSGKRVLIVRGVGGRETLAETLRDRGARVDYAEVYRRCRPVLDASALIADWSGQVQIASATSNAILDNLFALLGEAGQGLLRSTPLLVISQRMVEHAKKSGCRKVFLADSASDQALLDGFGRIATEL